MKFHIFQIEEASIDGLVQLRETGESCSNQEEALIRLKEISETKRVHPSQYTYLPVATTKEH